LEHVVDLSIRLGTYPQPGTWPRVVILVIVVITVLAAVRLGYGLSGVVTLVLGAGLAAAQIARALLSSRRPGEAP
jgi:hypothetical protein